MPKVVMKDGDGILNFKPGMKLGVKFMSIYSIHYSGTKCQEMWGCPNNSL